jgi:hypothetical protein
LCSVGCILLLGAAGPSRSLNQRWSPWSRRPPLSIYLWGNQFWRGSSSFPGAIHPSFPNATQLRRYPFDDGKQALLAPGGWFWLVGWLVMDL